MAVNSVFDSPGGNVRAVAIAAIERLRIAAVVVGRLIPFDIEIMFAGLRRIGFVSLVVITDVVAPEVELIKAVLGRPFSQTCPNGPGLMSLYS